MQETEATIKTSLLPESKLAVAESRSFSTSSLMDKSFSTVSYTHLDVYKRQPLKKANVNLLGEKIQKMVIANAIGIPVVAIGQGLVALIGYLIFGAPSAVLLFALTCVASMLPVSYTHLDVYKRQDFTSIDIWSIPGMKLYYGLSGLLGLVLAPLYVGVIYVANKYNFKQPVNFSDLFIGYKQNFLNIVIYSLISSIIFTVTFMMCLLPGLLVMPFLMLGLSLIHI